MQVRTRPGPPNRASRRLSDADEQRGGDRANAGRKIVPDAPEAGPHPLLVEPGVDQPSMCKRKSVVGDARLLVAPIRLVPDARRKHVDLRYRPLTEALD